MAGDVVFLTALGSPLVLVPVTKRGPVFAYRKVKMYEKAEDDLIGLADGQSCFRPFLHLGSYFPDPR